MAHTVRRSEPSYADWVNRGRRRPTHGEFAGYLRDTAAHSAAQVHIGTVKALGRTKRGWRVAVAAGALPESSYGFFQGVVVSSPGPQAKHFSLPADNRILNGENFCRDPRRAQAMAKAAEDPIVVIGGSGAAAAVIAWFVRNGFAKREIQMIADQDTLFTRVDNLFENRLFEDDGAWDALSQEDRQAFNDRLTRAVVWESVTNQLAEAERLILLYGRATKVELGATARKPLELSVHYRPSGASKDFEQPAGLVIDASGFDNWWFADLLPKTVAARVRGQAKKLAKTMKPDLSLMAPTLTGLHAPVVSQAIGPGYGSLMVLGAMADRVLKPYVVASRP